ncbi:hypothetical protein GGI20_005221 [Coemansia sp. BCRC 34301]|nr:hypothetical protein GGI20_005221 [Coemansia sp. BCRC 34301]
MSVLNLEAHPNERTEIDDWESLIYVLCFLATFGINKVDREVLAEAREAGCFIRLKIKDWDTDRGMADIATYKRAHLYSRGMFRMTISSRFPVPKKDSRLPNYLRLRKLAIDLYMAMFQNKGVGKECRGTDDVDSDEDSQDTDQSDDNDDDDDDDTRQLLGGLTIEAGDSTDSPAVATSSDPFVNRAKESNRAIIIKSLYDKLEKHATKARERMGMGKGKSAYTWDDAARKTGVTVNSTPMLAHMGTLPG